MKTTKTPQPTRADRESTRAAEQEQRKQELIRQEREKRETACLKEIETILLKHNCNLEGVPVFTKDGRIAVGINVVAKV